MPFTLLWFCEWIFMPSDEYSTIKRLFCFLFFRAVVIIQWQIWALVLVSIKQICSVHTKFMIAFLFWIFFKKGNQSLAPKNVGHCRRALFSRHIYLWTWLYGCCMSCFLLLKNKILDFCCSLYKRRSHESKADLNDSESIYGCCCMHQKKCMLLKRRVHHKTGGLETKASFPVQRFRQQS